jgi:hypothetical protein
MELEICLIAVILVIVFYFMRQYEGVFLLQIYTLIVASYLNIFPSINYFFSENQDRESFFLLEGLLVIFFQIPLMILLQFGAKNAVKEVVPPKPVYRLSIWLPLLCCLFLAVFMGVAFYYDLFFRRVGHEGLVEMTNKVPTFLLYLYRAVSEIAIYLIILFATIVGNAGSNTKFYRFYKVVFVVYLITFFIFFFINSRLQLVLLFLCLICTQPRFIKLATTRLRFFISLTLLASSVVLITLIRELGIENNGGVEIYDIESVATDTIRLIAARLDSLTILYRLRQYDINFFEIDLTGLSNSFLFYKSFFVDPDTYDSIKNSLMTSPTVVIVNQYLPSGEIDFPKAMILDVFVSFGIFGLLGCALILASLLTWIYRSLGSFYKFSSSYLVAIYLLPLIFQFEKEFSGFLISFIKWCPLLFLTYLMRPRCNVLTETNPVKKNI